MFGVNSIIAKKTPKTGVLDSLMSLLGR